MTPETVALPEVSQRELMILLAGLDELPGKVSRVLYDKIVGHVNAQVSPDPPACGPTRGEIFGYGDAALGRGSAELEQMGGDQGAAFTAASAGGNGQGLEANPESGLFRPQAL